MVRRLLVALVLASFAGGRAVRAGEATCSIALGDAELQIDVPALEELCSVRRKIPEKVAAWAGQLGESEVSIEIEAWSQEKLPLVEPEDVTDHVAATWTKPAGGGPAFRYATREIVEGSFGAAPYASLCTGALPFDEGGTASPGETLVLGGVLAEYAFAVRVDAKPVLAAEHRALLRDFLVKGVHAVCKARVPGWTDDEARRRWEDAVKDPRIPAEPKKFVRTAHYIVLTDAPTGAAFGKKLEECYETVRKAFPFAEVAGRRLMPVFLFRTSDEYMGFCVGTGGFALPEANKTTGHARADYYASYADAPGAAHLHEATHQIFRSRLHLAGGGPWFQEGVAAYVETSTERRKAFAQRVTREAKFIPFRDLVQMKSLRHGEGDPEDAYQEAGSVIAFLRDGGFPADAFPRLVQEVGLLPGNDLAEIEAALRRNFGVDLAGLETAWSASWSK